MKKVNYKRKITALLLISVFSLSNIIFFEEIKLQNENCRSTTLSENQELMTPKKSDFLMVSVSPTSASKTISDTQQTFTYDLRDILDAYGGEWFIAIDSDPYVSQGFYSLSWSMSEKLYMDTVTYTSDTGLSIGTYNIHAKFTSTYGDVFEDATLQITNNPPPAPDNVNTYENPCYDGTASITWDKSLGATKYQLYEATSSGGAYSAIGPELGDVGSTTVSKTSEQTRFYKVKAGEVSGAWSSLSSSYAEISWSKPNSPTLSSPTTQTVYNNNSFSVTRASVGSYVDGFDWEVSIDGGTYADWSTSSLSTLSYNPPAGDHTYRFRLRVRNANFGVWSDYGESGIITISSPSTPLNFQVSEETCYDGLVTFSWTATTGATSYSLYEATTSDGTYTEIDSSIIESTTSIQKSSEDVLFFKLKAVNDVGESDFTGFIEVIWSAPETPIITTPITQTVYTTDLISVTRDSVEIYVDEFDWEISIDGEAYENLSTSILNSVSYNPPEEDHTYQFRLRVRNSEFGIWSEYGYSGILSIILADTDKPVINSPDDISYISTTTGNNITWTVSDNNPYQFQLFIDEIGQGVNIWDENELVFNIDGLSIGSHNVTLWICDNEGNWVQDQVNVTVINGQIPSKFSGLAIGSISAIFILGIMISIFIIKRKK
ncbi:hypothetical protein DSAG12_02788 [Promethearchaeum syntrophicum]|uniref:Fibronectin type III domain protein n=1 Tax=Promethearchaeum syntrophicum TaxID=2594042 RepID=A0A5B9DDK8_9ARCH|nr:hypothetical protein [Candidatus Prometheoarchaeum syntrophicum]QEE16957.1 hypothetical protein DSAG12_02788 [Candidatus Prometheoarchaeum syntrophicum]